MNVLRVLPVVLVLAIGLLSTLLARPVSAQEPWFLGEELVRTPLPPSLYARTFRIPIFNVDTGGLRFVTAFKETNRQRLTETLRDYTESADLLFKNAPIFRTLSDGSIDCDCVRDARGKR